MAHLSTRRKKLPQFKKRHYKLLQNKDCLFQSNRKNDQLNATLGNPKHIGRIRSVGSQMPWKHGFLKASTSYKKHDRYKKTLEEKVNTLFENMLMVFIQNLSQEGPPLHLLAPQATNLSSIGSMIGLGTWYPMDDITVDSPCYLHIPLSRVENKTK
jgi:hypothetical protein